MRSMIDEGALRLSDRTPSPGCCAAILSRRERVCRTSYPQEALPHLRILSRRLLSWA